MKLLINIPDLKLHGGVANTYLGLKEFWSIPVVYNIVGRRGKFPGLFFLASDYLKFFATCAFKKPDHIILNPSLAHSAVIRDSIFLKIASSFNIKTTIFFHGWQGQMVEQFNNNPKKFMRKFKRATDFFVLSSEFKKDLRNWGVNQPIHLMTTKVDDALLENFIYQPKLNNKTILFLTRIEKYKGIFITLEAFKIVKEAIPEASLIVAGNGSQLSSAKHQAKTMELNDVTFLGHVSGQNLIDTMSSANIYVLPTFGEGMPTSVLEAMAFGLPVVTRPVGGIVDFFKNGKMGYLIEDFDPNAFARVIIELLQDTEKSTKIGFFNHQYAKQNFMASEVVLKIEKIIIGVN